MCMLRIPAAFCLGDRDFCSWAARCLRTTFLFILFPGMSHGCLPLLPRLWAFWFFTRRTTHGSPHKVVLGTLVHGLLAATKVSVSQAEGGRYAKHAQGSWPPPTYDAAQNEQGERGCSFYMMSQSDFCCIGYA